MRSMEAQARDLERSNREFEKNVDKLVLQIKELESTNINQVEQMRRAEERADGLERSKLASEEDNNTFMKERMDNEKQI